MQKTFEYRRPATVEEAVEMKRSYGKSARYWAGGTDLMLLWKRDEADVGCCIDLTPLAELRYIRNGSNEVRIGALATLDDLARATEMNQLMAVLGTTAGVMNTWQTRTLATVGGNVCHASPSADLAPPLIALEAEARVVGCSGERTIPMEDFFQGVNQTAMRDEELLIEIRVPVPPLRREASHKRVTRTVLDIALASAAACLTTDEHGAITDARVSLGAVAPTPIRSRAAEEALLGASLSSLDKGALAEVGRLAAQDTSPISDVRASAEYRRRVSEVLTRRAIEEAVLKLGGNIT